jgi:rubrerythrin
MSEAHLNPLEALQMALKREVAAEEFYLTAAKKAEEESSRKMFEFLAAEERKHQRIIQEEIDRNFLKEM